MDYLLKKLNVHFAPSKAGRATRPWLRTGGFSTLEILLAMTILIVTLTSVTLTSFGSQTMQTDAETSTEALRQAQSGLEYMQTLARKDFHLVTPTSSLTTLGAVTYQKSISISTTSLPDYATKEITSTVTWTGENNRPQHVTLSALVTNFDHAVGGDTCDSVSTGNWTLPVIKNAITELSSLTGTTSGFANMITSVDAYKGKLYVTVSSSQYITDPRLFIFDIQKLKTDSTNALLGKLATATTTPASSGMYAVHVAEGPLNRRYAYIAGDYQANWSVCPAYYNCAQLTIADVTDPSALTLASTTYYKLPNVTSGVLPGGTARGGAGSSIYYKDGLVYLGLGVSAYGPEFHIVDVHDPKNPISRGSLEIGADVNAIRVVGNIAYIAVNKDNSEVMTVDVTNPATPLLIGITDAPGQIAAGYGRSLGIVGDSLFLGRSSINGGSGTALGSEFLILDASSSLGIIPSLPIGWRDVGTNADPFTIFGIVPRGQLIFFVGGSPSGIAKLYIENIANLNNITDWAPPLTLPNYLSNSSSFAIDCEGNDIFVGSRDALNTGYLSVITSTP